MNTVWEKKRTIKETSKDYKEIRGVSLKLQKKKPPSSGYFTVEFYQIFKEKLTPKLTHSLP